MHSGWQSEFRSRMRQFELSRAPRKGEMSVSLKVRVASGCFHREHSPYAYRLIDEHLTSQVSQRCEFTLVEHESGPELLVYAALATAGLTLAKSVIDLVTAIIKARSKGIKEGDRPSDPVEVIVRRVDDGGKFVEESVLRVGHPDPISREEIQAEIDAAMKRLIQEKRGKTASRAVPRVRRRDSSKR